MPVRGAERRNSFPPAARAGNGAGQRVCPTPEVSPLWFCRCPHPNEPAGRAAQLPKTFLKYTEPSVTERGGGPGSAQRGARGYRCYGISQHRSWLLHEILFFFSNIWTRLTSNPLTNRTAIPGLVLAVTEPRELHQNPPDGRSRCAKTPFPGKGSSGNARPPAGH